MKAFTFFCVAALLGVVIAHDKGKRKDKFMKTWETCATEAGCKQEMFAPLKEASGTLSEDDSTKKCVFCLMTKMEMATDSGDINKEKCEKMSGHFAKKRDEKKEALVACCKKTEGVPAEDSCFNVLKCWKEAVGSEALFRMKRKDKSKGKSGE